MRKVTQILVKCANNIEKTPLNSAWPFGKPEYNINFAQPTARKPQSWACGQGRYIIGKRYSALCS